MPNLKEATTPPPNLKDMVQVEMPAAHVSPPPVADQTSMPGYESLSLAPPPTILSTDVDRQRQFYRRGVSQYRIPPLPTKANPSINASVRTITTQVVSQAVDNLPSSGLSSVGLSMPPEFSVANSPLTSDGTINVAWVTERPGTYLGVLGQTGVPFPEDSEVSGTTGSGSTTVSLTTGTESSYALLYFLCRATQGTGTVGPTGGTWTSFFSSGLSTDTWSGWMRTGVSPNTTVNETASYTNSNGLNAICNMLVSFPTTATPVITSLAFAGGSIPNPANLPAVSVLSGRSLMMIVAGNELWNSGVPGGTTVSAVTDNQNNTWYQVAAVYTFVSGSPNPGTSAFLSFWFCPNPKVASTAVTVNFVSGTGSGASSRAELFSITNLANADAGIPFFKYINATDLVGILPLGNGGTGTNLANTGGTSKFVRQNSVGAALDVVQPDYTDLQGISLPTQFGGFSLAANGFPVELATVNRTTQSANVGATGFSISPSVPAGLYRVTVYMVVSRAASTSSTMPDSRITFTDRDSNATITMNMTPGDTGNTTSTFAQASAIINVKAATAIQYDIGQVTPFASSGGTSMQFAYRARLEYLG